MFRDANGDLNWLKMSFFMNSPCLFWKELPLRRAKGVEGHCLTKVIICSELRRIIYIGPKQLSSSIYLVYL